jgi:hypothetical protein
VAFSTAQRIAFEEPFAETLGVAPGKAKDSEVREVGEVERSAEAN